MTRWFGRAHGAPYEEETAHAPTPTGARCAWCEEKIEAQDDGLLVPLYGPEPVELPFHYACHFRRIVGGLNHLMGRCFCCGGDQPADPPNMGLREAARLATKHWLTTKHKRTN
jgi:hypothetical protein